MKNLRDAVRDALDAAENATPAQAVAAVTGELGTALGASGVSLMVADLSGRALVLLAELDLTDAALRPETGLRHELTETARVVPFDGSPAEQALRTQTVQVLPPGDPAAAGTTTGRWTVIAPVSERGDTMGLLQMSLPVEPPPAVLQEIARAAHQLAFVLVAARRHTDLFEWGQRTTPFTLSAEIQRRLLPPAFTCEGGGFTLAAWLEPSATAGGDTFDYSTARDHLRFSLTDAMGHGVAAALAATLCVGSLRGTRRRGGSLLEQAQQANTAILDHATSIAADTYVTGLLGELDLRTGVLQLVNAGHVAPYLAPAAGDHPHPIALPTDHPFGMFPNTEYRMTEIGLYRGDRLVLITDGMVERNAATVDLPAEIARTRDLHPREATRHLADAVIAATGGNLGDDATLMVLDWHDTPRHTTSGADPDTASSRLP